MADTSNDRARNRLAWARRALDDPHARLAPASSDASFRSYWRVEGHSPSLVVMDAPPPQEDVKPWLDVGQRLRDAGLNAPGVHAQDTDAGFLLIDDLGSRHYLDALGDGTADTLYADATDALLRMQAHVDVRGIAPYDRAFLIREMELLPDWFLGRHLGAPPDSDQAGIIGTAFRRLADSALAQPRCFVHRDFHSRNLLVVETNNPGIIDFQGALVGPITYDLASLLRDCYIAWDNARVEAWVEGHRQRLIDAGLIGVEVDARTFLRWFDLIGLQRHVKVLGLFCRLHYRDGKGGYLDDLPRVLDYVLSVARRHSALADFADLLTRAVGERDVSRPAPGDGAA